MMRRRVGVFLLIATLFNVLNCEHEPPAGTPSFVRSSVESVPEVPGHRSEPLVSSVYGETSLPLRSAVESIPSLPESSGQSFIRSAIESRPESEKIRYADNMEVAASEIKENLQDSNGYGAYVIPNRADPFSPQPFRSGSPFQQLLDGRYGEIDENTHFKGEQNIRYRDMAKQELAPKKVLCYLTNWSFYRSKDGKFVPELLDAKLCSHIIYSFGSLDPSTLTVKHFDKWADIDNDLYRRTTSLSKDVPVLLAIGGWTDSTGDKYSKLVREPSARRHFIRSLISFMGKYGFRGVHFDWNYPKCWQSDCRKGPESDKPNFARLIQEMQTEFKKHDYILGVGISGYKEIILKGYDIPKLSDAADFLTVMSYDYHGAWEKQTGHLSPLYGKSDDKYPQYNTHYTLELLKQEGATASKIIVGVPFYGQSFTLEQSSEKLIGEGIAARGPGKAGEITKQPGMLAYYEICERIKNKNWRKGRESSKKSGPFAMLGDQWVGFEDAESIAMKAKYVIDSGFGGIAAWTVDLDDYSNRCCMEAFPLLKSINRAFNRIDLPKPIGADCRKPAEPVTPIVPVTTTVGENGIPGPVNESNEPTTWPSWKPGATTSNPSNEVTSSTESWWPTQATTTYKPITTTRRTTTSTTTEDSVVIEDEEEPIIPAPVNTMPVIVPGIKCESEGQYQSHPTSCTKYYQCVYGLFKTYDCASGLHWNNRGKLCDWPSSAKCAAYHSGDSPKPTVTSTNPAIYADEEYTTKRTTTPKPVSSSRKPASTTKRSTTRMSSTRMSSTKTTTKSTTVKPFSVDSSSSGSCNNGEYRGNPDDCESYFICVNHKWIPNDCGNGYHFDMTTAECGTASKVRCVSVKRYLKHFEKLRTLQLDDPCEGNQFVPYPGKCENFLHCLHGSLQQQDCPGGLHFNKEEQICDWPSHAQCDEQGNEVLPESDGTNFGQGEMGYIPITTTTTTTTTQKPKPVTPRPPVKDFTGDYKLVCYFTNWAWYRRGIAKYTPDDIDSRLCTHIVYGFAVLDYSELTIRTHDSWADIDNKFYDRVAGFQQKGVNVSLALGGWNDSQGDKYSRLVRSPPARKKFVKQAVGFLEKYGFGGLDLDWEYPKCWQTECNKGFSDEKEGFAELVRELSIAFKPKGLLLSSAVSPSKTIIDEGYDVPKLSKYFDWIAVMTYDFHGQWDKKTGHVAPLYHHPADDNDFFNSNYSLNYWIEKGAPPKKIIMGMPLYGQSFTLADPKKNGLNANAPGPGTAGEYTRAAGFLAYYEICDRINNKGWTVVQDPKRRMGPYAYKGNQWVSFDDRAMIRQKAKLVRSLGLGGGMVWALDLDDFKNHCGEGVHPLLSELQSVLSAPASGSDHQPAEISTESSIQEEIIGDSHDPPGTIIDETPVNNGQSVSEMSVENGQSVSAEIVESSPESDYKVVCYFTNWAWYRQGGGKYLPEDIDGKLCTHIVYGFAVLDREKLTIKPHDTWADFDNHFYERVVAYKKKGAKVTVAIGGWNDSAGDKYSRLVRDPAARARFIKHVIEFIEKHNFDGLDLDWEYPVCWQVECSKGHADEKQHFADLVRELSKVFRPRGLLLSSAVSPSKTVIDAGYDVPKLSKYFDWIAVMAYDYHGQWDKQTGHVAPMYHHPLDTNPTFNTNFTINYWIEKGADSRKLILGMPMYGQSFSLAENKRHGLNSPTYGGGEAGEATRARGFLSYYEICERIQKNGWKVIRDEKGRMGPYAYQKDQWVSFDDALMIRHKSEFVKAMNLGGAMIWALDLDDFKNYCGCEEYPLLRTINRVLRNYPGPHPKCKLEKVPGDEEYVSTDGHDETETLRPTSEKPKPKPTTSKPTTRTTTKKASDESSYHEQLDCGSSLFLADPSDCNAYYLCDNGRKIHQRCASGLHWNKDHCDWPANTNCESDPNAVADPNRPVTSPRPTTTTTRKPRPKPPSVEIAPEKDDGKFKVVCYFTNWAWYRPGEGKYLPEDIDENLCTHIVYGFAVLDGTTLTIKTHDSWADIDNNFYERVTEYRNKGKRVTVAIGGWNDSAGDKYSRLVLSENARFNFVTSTIEFIEKYGFEGLDLDWEYPVCWQVECHKGKAEEKKAFAELVKELSEEFKPRGWLLSAAVSPSKMVIDAGYDIPTLAEYFDWIAVMTYDYHGQWDRQTGHVAPLFHYPGDRWDYFNSNYTINYWIQGGAPSRKIIMGVPMYGQSFVLSSPSNSGLNSPSYGGGEAGKYTRANGFLSYYEICDKTNRDGWTVVRDSKGRIGPYAHKGNQWVSYDDVENVRIKAKYMRDMNLGGGMIWALDLDDFKGTCGCGKYPLLTTMNQVLRGIGGTKLDNCT